MGCCCVTERDGRRIWWINKLKYSPDFPTGTDSVWMAQPDVIIGVYVVSSLYFVNFLNLEVVFIYQVKLPCWWLEVLDQNLYCTGCGCFPPSLYTLNPSLYLASHDIQDIYTGQCFLYWHDNSPSKCWHRLISRFIQKLFKCFITQRREKMEARGTKLNRKAKRERMKHKLHIDALIIGR